MKAFNHKFQVFFIVLLLCSLFTTAQQLQYQTFAVGNTHVGKPGPHMQNHATDMDVSADGTCTVTSVWDEGGHSWGKYKEGAYIGASSIEANSKQETDNQGRSWTIENYYGRFINAHQNHGGSDGLETWKIDPVPTGANAPLVKCSNGWMITDVEDPGAIGINKNTGELMIADNGPDQDIKIYNISGSEPVLTGTFGVKGGVWAGSTPGLKDSYLKFCGITGVGGDAQGNLYVVNDGYPGSEGEGGGAHLWSFNPNGTLRWKMESSAFVASGVVDPNSNGTVIQGVFIRWEVDYTQTTPNAAKTVAININPYKYPDDPRLVHALNTCFAVRYINNVKYMWCTDMRNNMVYVFRFDGEIAVPCAAFTTLWGWNGDEYIRNYWKWNQGRPLVAQLGAYTRYLWCDRNGDALATSNEFETFNWGESWECGLEVDDNGNFYIGTKTNMYKFPANSFDSFGNPQYTAASRTTFFSMDTWIQSMKYVFETDQMVIGTTPLNGADFTQAKIYSNFMNGTPTLQRTIQLLAPQNNGCDGTGVAQVTADKDYVYSSYACENGHFTGTRGEVVINRITDGSLVGYITPGPEVESHSGWIDMTLPTHPFVKSTGERIITVEDDAVGKILVYKWCPTGNCDVGGGSVESISILPETLLLKEGLTKQLRVSYTPFNADNKDVTWSSSDETVVTVSTYGLVTAIKVGTAQVTATSEDGGKTAMVSVSVIEALKIAHTPVKLTIDGTLNEGSWNIDNLIAKPTSGEQNNEGHFDLLWDSDYLYVGATIKDSQVKSSPGNDPWENDAVEIFIDGNQNKGASYDNFDIQIIKSMGSTSAWTSRSASGLKSAIALIDGGYSVEVAIPWSVMKATPASGLGLGFDISYDDNDTGGRDGSTTWSGDGNNYSNTSMFGDLILLEGVITGTENEIGNSGIKVYPNPSNTGFVTIDFNDGLKTETVQVNIIDLMGKSVYGSGKLSHVSKVTVGTHGYSSGTYIIRVSKGKQIVNRKLIIGQ